MFYYISGKLAALGLGYAVIDAGGVGYRLTVSQTTVGALPAARSADDRPQAKLFTHMAVREDGIELFGFATEEELDSFRMLIGVSGVGPKAAISILSLLTPEKLARAICTDNKKAISAANGVGPKTAARIVLELKDKLHAPLTATDEDASLALISDEAPADNVKDARDALTVLGYSRSEAEAALRKLDTAGKDVDQLIREALKKLM